VTLHETLLGSSIFMVAQKARNFSGLPFFSLLYLRTA